MQSVAKQDLLSQLYELPEKLEPEQAKQLMEETLRAYEEHIDRFLPLYVRVLGEEMLEWRAEGSWLYSPTGERWMDCLGAGGVFGLGFRHPKVVDAVKKQIDRVGLSSRLFLNPVTAACAKKLASLAPEGLDQVFFANSGTESLEAALKLARLASGKPGIVGTHFGYHGMSIATLSISGLEAWRKGTEPAVGGSAVIGFNDIEQVRKAVTKDTAALVLEPVQWASGCEVATTEYLKAVREHCDKVGAFLIFDEVQCGLGRAGTLWGCTPSGVIPDILCVGKILSGGVMPIAAVIYNAKVRYGERDRPQFNNSSYGGNPMSCAAGLAALNVMTDDGVLERAIELGSRLGTVLDEWVKKYPKALKSHRGAGLMRCLELKQPSMGSVMQDFARKRHVIVASMMHMPQFVRVSPPFTASDEEFDFFLKAVEESLEELSKMSLMDLMRYNNDFGKHAQQVMMQLAQQRAAEEQ
jgi:putrescine aminotransferase